MTDQLTLELDPAPVSPNAWMFNADGSPKRLLWCSDSARLGGPCPYGGRYRDGGECCKTLAAPSATIRR